ncbi:MAG: helix-turn-helix domain-containing protein [Candidatus Omnitrophota bacterium]|nr:helix-turn-helix domain-containing protein [Candidatus Omnitrophota bacterium]
MENNKREPRPAAVSIGRRLKEAREKKPLTIEQVQKQTKIHSTVLIALEEGRASEILTDTYVRSFLKKYTQVLNLPTNEILKEYFPPRAEPVSLGAPAHESPLPAETKIGPKALYFTGIAILSIAALLLAIIIGGKVITAFNKAKLTRQQKQVAEVVASKKKIQKPVKSVQKKKPAPKTDSESKDIIPKSTPLSLVIKVREPVLVKLTKDGILIFSRVMSKGLVETITANNSIELDIGKVQALELILNGRQIALPTKKNISGLIITRKGVKLK